MPGVKVKWKGIDMMGRSLNTGRKLVNAAVNVGLYELAANVMDEARSLAPVDTGRLRKSGYVTRPRRGGVELGFSAFSESGSAVDYAIIQHEDTSLQHRVGGSKFLSRALANHGKYFRNMAADVRKALDQNIKNVNPRYPTTPKKL